ncbi:hypothetical protein B566_EDAN010092 [Ephemera danica]|nr:hypothetical protein B566_EDAN010092 [Ephemera danica]
MYFRFFTNVVFVSTALSGFEVENKYMVKNSMGQDIYTAQERSDMCGRQCCGANRKFDMHISDNFSREVIHLNRPLNCCGCCFPCWCLQTMEISSPPGTVVGSIKEEWSIFKHKYNLLDEAGNVAFRIEKNCCFCECCSDINFKILSASGEQVGNITKQFGGFAKETITNADNFSVTFPMNLDVKMKADFKHFESRNTQKK